MGNNYFTKLLSSLIKILQTGFVPRRQAQHRGSLHTNHSVCCLAHAADIATKDMRWLHWGCNDCDSGTVIQHTASLCTYHFTCTHTVRGSYYFSDAYI